MASASTIMIYQSVEIAKTVPEIIKEASKSVAGLFALMILILGILAFYFFRSADEKTRIGIFVLVFAGAGLYGYALFGAFAPKRVNPALGLSGPTTEQTMYLGGTIVNGDDDGVEDATIRITENEDRGSSDKLGAFHLRVTGALSGSVVHLRVTKDGFKPVNLTVGVPNENLAIRLTVSNKTGPSETHGRSIVNSTSSANNGAKPIKLFTYDYPNMGNTCKGSIKQISETTWIEETIATDGCLTIRYSFTQVSTDGNHITLWDKSRNYGVRLPLTGEGFAEGSSSLLGPWVVIHPVISVTTSPIYSP